MKITTKFGLLICGGLLAATLFTAVSQEITQQSKGSPPTPIFEYASVRFMEEKTSIVWPDLTVENVMELSGKKKFPGGEYYPKGSDYRMYWLTAAMNIMSKKGYELVHMDGADIVMRRMTSK